MPFLDESFGWQEDSVGQRPPSSGGVSLQRAGSQSDAGSLGEHSDAPSPSEKQEDAFHGSVHTAEDAGLVREKSIGSWGSLLYLVNQIFGPGILAVPVVFVQAGFVPSFVANLVVCLASCFCATKLMSAIQMIPGNTNLEKRIEYTDAVEYFYGKQWAMIFRIFLHGTLQSINIASIVSTALAFDKLFATWTGATLSLQLYPDISFAKRDVHWINDAYNDDFVVTLTAGYLMVLVACVPMGFYNIDDNIIVQVVSFWLLLILMGIFVFQYADDWIADLPDDPLFPAWFGQDYTQLLSVYILSYSYTMLIMPWANEVKPEVRKKKWVWISGTSSCASYLVIGTMLACCFPGVTSDNILIEVLRRKFVLPEMLAAAYGFAAFVILPGIPVFCITTRYDLVSGGLCSNKWGIFWGNVAPWLVAWLCTPGEIFGDLITWTSLVMGSVTNFVIPLFVYRAAVLQMNEGLTAGLQGERSTQFGGCSSPPYLPADAPFRRWSMMSRDLVPVRSTRNTNIVLAFVIVVILVGIVISAFKPGSRS